MIGVGVPTLFAGRALTREDLIGYVRVCEEGGASGILVGDHMNWYVPSLECLTTLAFVAARTELPVMSNVVVAPLRRPFELAKKAATIAYLAQGGFTLGIGAGGEHMLEFEAADVPVNERGGRTDEMLAVLNKLFTGEQVDHRGTYYTMTAARLSPAPRIPIMIGGRSKNAIRRAARFADGWSGAWVTPTQLAERMDWLREALRHEDRDFSAFRKETHIRLAIGSDAESAWAEAAEFLSKHYNTDPAPFKRHTIAGDPDAVTSSIRQFLAVGIDRVNVTFAGADQLTQARVFTTKVLPQLLTP